MPQDVVEFLFRWVHFLSGITWIGLLYFFNFVNARAMAVIDASARPHVVTTLLPRALAWFRHAAWVTVLAGLILIYWKYWRVGNIVDNEAARTILIGGLLGIIMAINVWVFIWPNQKKIIAATREGKPPDPAWAKTALYFSRTNVTLSFPMLLFMGGATHFPMDWDGIIVWGVITAAIGFAAVMSVQKWAAAHF